MYNNAVRSFALQYMNVTSCLCAHVNVSNFFLTQAQKLRAATRTTNSSISLCETHIQMRRDLFFGFFSSLLLCMHFFDSFMSARFFFVASFPFYHHRMTLWFWSNCQLFNTYFLSQTMHTHFMSNYKCSRRRKKKQKKMNFIVEWQQQSCQWQNSKLEKKKWRKNSIWCSVFEIICQTERYIDVIRNSLNTLIHTHTPYGVVRVWEWQEPIRKYRKRKKSYWTAGMGMANMHCEEAYTKHICSECVDVRLAFVCVPY